MRFTDCKERLCFHRRPSVHEGIGYLWSNILSRGVGYPGGRVSGVGYHGLVHPGVEYTLPPGKEATDAVGRFPTGMLSCLFRFHNNFHLYPDLQE